MQQSILLNEQLPLLKTCSLNKQYWLHHYIKIFTQESALKRIYWFKKNDYVFFQIISNNLKTILHNYKVPVTFKIMDYLIQLNSI